MTNYSFVPEELLPAPMQMTAKKGSSASTHILKNCSASSREAAGRAAGGSAVLSAKLKRLKEIDEAVEAFSKQKLRGAMEDRKCTEQVFEAKVVIERGRVLRPKGDEAAPTASAAGEKSEKEKIREFWLSLSDEERRNFVLEEKESVLKIWRDEQRFSCTCSFCGKKRSVIEEEVETLYDAYFEGLESFTKQLRELESLKQRGLFADHSARHAKGRHQHFLRSGIVNVAENLLKNDAKKFLEIMDRIAERKLRKEYGEDPHRFASDDEAYEEEWEDKEDDEDDFLDDEIIDDDDDKDQELSDEQQMEEGRRIFQVIAAQTFEQRVSVAYRERLALEKQKQLLKEVEEEERLKKEKEQAKLESKLRKKEKKLKQREEKERERLEQERLLEESKQRALEQLELQRKKEAELKRLEREKQLQRDLEAKAEVKARPKKDHQKSSSLSSLSNSPVSPVTDRPPDSSETALTEAMQCIKVVDKMQEQPVADKPAVPPPPGLFIPSSPAYSKPFADSRSSPLPPSHRTPTFKAEVERKSLYGHYPYPFYEPVMSQEYYQRPHQEPSCYQREIPREGNFQREGISQREAAFSREGMFQRETAFQREPDPLAAPPFFGKHHPVSNSFYPTDNHRGTIHSNLAVSSPSSHDDFKTIRRPDPSKRPLFGTDLRQNAASLNLNYRVPFSFAESPPLSADGSAFGSSFFSFPFLGNDLK